MDAERALDRRDVAVEHQRAVAEARDLAKPGAVRPGFDLRHVVVAQDEARDVLVHREKLAEPGRARIADVERELVLFGGVRALQLYEETHRRGAIDRPDHAGRARRHGSGDVLGEPTRGPRGRGDDGGRGGSRGGLIPRGISHFAGPDSQRRKDDERTEGTDARTDESGLRSASMCRISGGWSWTHRAVGAGGGAT